MRQNVAVCLSCEIQLQKFRLGRLTDCAINWENGKTLLTQGIGQLCAAGEDFNAQKLVNRNGKIY